MKKIALYILASFVLLACKKESLDIKNPNQPTTDVLNNEDAFNKVAFSIVSDGTGAGGGQGNFGIYDINFTWLVAGNHEIMGDALYIPWGNFGWRWANHVTSITLDDASVFNSVTGTTQYNELNLRNSIAFGGNGGDNAYYAEWAVMYYINNASNLIIRTLDEDIVEFSGDASTKENVYRAWAHFWKGYAYSRIGSMYVAGLILDEYGTTKGDYVTNVEMLAEAEAQFKKSEDILNSLTDNDTYSAILTSLIPSNLTNDYPSPDVWIKNINTMRARNLLVNTKVADMTSADWTNVLTLANAGIESGDFEFSYKNDGVFITSTTQPHRTQIGWSFLSERLVQDFKAGDQRNTRNVEALSSPVANQSGRGIQFGTRWGLIPVEDGGDYASDKAGLNKQWVGPSYEENELMKAEAKIYTNDIDGGLAHIDAIRTLQDAGLAAVAGTGLTADEAKEELRKERRIGLFLRGVAFYDARRWGVIDPVSAGGGRTGAVVLSATGAVNTNATINYNYISYFGVPAEELTYNPANDGAAAVTANPK